MKVKCRKYVMEQRKFLNEYISPLCEIGYLIPNPNATRQVAPHLTSKNSRSKSGTTIDLWPDNAATKSQTWPIPSIETELADFCGSNYFAVPDLCARYWQCPLHPDSYDFCGIVTRRGPLYRQECCTG